MVDTYINSDSRLCKFWEYQLYFLVLVLFQTNNDQAQNHSYLQAFNIGESHRLAKSHIKVCKIRKLVDRCKAPDTGESPKAYDNWHTQGPKNVSVYLARSWKRHYIFCPIVNRRSDKRRSALKTANWIVIASARKVVNILLTANIIFQIFDDSARWLLW